MATTASISSATTTFDKALDDGDTAMTDLSGLMQQAQDMQAKLGGAQAKLAALEVEGHAGGGLVTLTLKGSGEMTGVRIDDSLLVPGDAETLQDLIAAAHADAKSKLDAASQKLMADAMGPMAGLMGGGFPGLGGF